MLAWDHPAATRNDTFFAGLIELSRAYFNGRKVGFDELTLDLPAPGSFSGKLYRAARQIAYGRTISYQGLARQIGQPDAARAVATALGKNPLPLLIPCHRVIYADGGLGGFSAIEGVQQKRRLLDLEAAAISA
jgi:methylated-DNA-[protein]-cysteine S-methyltransferase